MKKWFTLKCLLCTLLFFAFSSKGFSQLLTEDFNYNAGTLLTTATTPGFTAFSGAGTNAITVTSPGLTYSGSTSSGVGNAVTMAVSGEDDSKNFTAVTSGSVYSSFFINVPSSAGSGDYFYSLYDNGGYKGRVFIKSTTGGYFFGISKNSATATYETNVRTIGTTYLVVIKYTFNTASTTDDVVSLYVNPVLGATEPTATIPETTSSGAADAATAGIDRIALRQGSSGSSTALILDAIKVGTTWASVTPVVSPTTTSISPTSANANSGAFTLTVNGTNFINGSTITWNGSSRPTTFVSSTQLTAAIPGTDLSTAGTATVGVTTTGAASQANTQTFNINAVSGGSISLTATLVAFGNVCTGTTAGPNSFTISGSNLDGTNISIAALAGFAYSTSSAGPFSSTLSFSYTNGSFTGKIIYVQFSPTAVQDYSGNIILSGGNIAGNSYPVAASGAGINNGPTVVTGTTASAVSSTSATVSGSITATGCSAITAYGIEYSANSGFATGTGTQLAASNISGGNYSVILSGLTPNTKYYFHAYAVSGGTTTYGAEQNVTATPSPVVMSAQTGLSYTQTFDDIATWSNFFITGNGANHFGGLSAATVGAVPDGKTITASTNSFQGATFGSSGGLQRGTDQSPATQSIVLLATGTSDNTTSTAIDFYMDFTGLNAGTLSFDWAAVNNSTGNRNSSLRVYTSIDGVNFDTLKNASVLNFTNNSLTNDTKANIPLPASFNNSATARLRFYVYNGTGGSTGSRPKLSIDNLTVTAVATTPCATPTAPATNLVFGNITDTTIAGSFTGSGASADGYIVVASTNSSLTKNPDDGQIYNLGDNLGDGTVVAKGSSTSFVASGLTASTLYYFFVFPMNSICTGGPLYYSTNFLTGQTTTAAGLPTCAAPAQQPTAYTAGAITTNTIKGSFTAAAADEYLVLASTSATFTGTLTNGQLYSNGDAVGNATVVQRNNTTSFTASGLAANTPYYFYIFSSNTQACVNGPAYNSVSPLTSGAQTTSPLPACSTPTAQPTQLTFNTANSSISGAFAPSTSADSYLVVISTSNSAPAPVNGTSYNLNDNLGGGIVVSNNAATGFMMTGIAPATQYYFYVFATNKNCAGGPLYLKTNPLTSSATTTNVTSNNYYFGNWHSHSDYSDGNKDHPGYTPADDYTYAKTAQCFDFLGISEHNHYSGGDPGNKIDSFHKGSVLANTFTANNPGFLAMYGMEWGVISGGGHVVVYGDGMDSLFGWESGSGGWGANNNYDVYVPKSVYTGSTGLFKTVNDHVATNTFATLAHPNQTDYNNLAGVAYDAVADSAIVGCAVESGPATSTNTTYTNPGTSLSYLSYFQTLLAKGYHLGPNIDHDNHNTTFGHTTYSRTAVVAPALTKTEIVKGMRNMHFYSTQDCDSKIDFQINTKIMGSVMTDRYAPNLYVYVSDATTDFSSAVIKIMYGVPGSGVAPVKIDSAIGAGLTFTDNNLANLATGYYYVDVTKGTTRIITSPIWYTRNDATTAVVLPITLTTFAAQKVNSTVKLTWTTAQETNSKQFVIERSADGANWSAIGTQAAAGNSSIAINYAYFDNTPLNGINYYRLKEMDVDGKFTYSDIRSVLFASSFQLSITPNPARDFINLYVSNTNNETYQVQLTDINGKTLQSIRSTEQHLQLNTSTLAKGVYFVKFINNSAVTTKKVVIE